ncbi:hypothetical protein [Mucilaginibacter antarcticus]|uniref:Uncharacterized protein n=1 Tax=Mucilaginibacter antarcticus TaxID=1855725 RepID=A0ABW5XM81_9SPHI
MSQQTGFMPHRQFHVLVAEANEEQYLTVLPDPQGNFRVIKHGEVLGEVNYRPKNKIVCYKGKLKRTLMDQLKKHIDHQYSYAY